MRHGNAVIGLCMLCALVASAIAAQGASAKGTTAFTCAKATGTGAGFSREHCKRADAVGSGAKFEHKEIANGTTTEVIVTNAKTNSETNAPEPFLFGGSIAGIPIELKATTVSGTGTVSNSEVSGEMIASGTGTIIYTGVTVTKPAGQGCKVKEEKITTAKLKSTSQGQPTPEEESNAEMFRKTEPNQGTIFAAISIEGCTTTALNGTFNVTGSIKGRPDGATTVFTTEDTKNQNTLKLAGQSATLNGKITFSSKKSTDTTFTPLSVTTR